MAYCTKCGNAIVVTEKFCANCGNAVHKQNAPQNLSSKQASFEATPNDLSGAWKNKFRLIQAAGGPKLSKIKELPMSERQTVVFNIWGMLFGPLYYLYLGMWKKAIPLFCLTIIGLMVLEMLFRKFGIRPTALNFVGGMLFAVRVNVDYYKNIVLRDEGWI